MNDLHSSVLNIILLHGTWGRGVFLTKPVAPWCKPNSEFVLRLKSALAQRMPTVRINVTPFNWSGSNSIFHRAKAAADLKHVLNSQNNNGVATLVIAHSHGGNIALQAVTNAEHASKQYVCTLATPFLRIFENERVIHGAGTVLMIPALAIVGYLIAQLWPLIPVSLRTYRSELLALMLVVWIIGALFAAFFLERLIVNPLPKQGTKLTSWQGKPRLLCEATTVHATLLGDRLLILRGIDDEAGLSLALGAVANRITRFLYDISARRLFHTGWRPNILAMLSILLVMLVIIVSPLWRSLDPHYLVLIEVGLVLSVANVSLLLPIAIRLVFGREFAFGATRCDVMFDSVPDVDRAQVMTLQPGQDAIVHALYEHPRAPIVIADWVADSLSARDLVQAKSIGVSN